MGKIKAQEDQNDLGMTNKQFQLMHDVTKEGIFSEPQLRSIFLDHFYHQWHEVISPSPTFASGRGSYLPQALLATFTMVIVTLDSMLMIHFISLSMGSGGLTLNQV